MNIQLSVLKPLLKKLSCVKGDSVLWDAVNGILSSREGNLTVYVYDDSLKVGTDTFVFPSKKFLPSINKMSGTIDIQKTDNGYCITSNKTKIELERGTKAWKPDLSFQNPISVKTSVLQKLLTYVQIASDPKQQAMTFAGLISLTGYDDFLTPRLEAVATDGKRIALATEETETGDFSLLLPSSLAITFPHLSGDTTQFFDSENNTIVRSGGFVAVANKFTAKFPDAKKLFPTVCNFKATANVTDFREALDRIQPMLDEETHAVELDFKDVISFRTIGKGGSASDEIGYARSLLNQNPPLTAIFDHKFMTDFFATANGWVTIEHTIGKDFIVLKNENKKYLMSRMSK